MIELTVHDYAGAKVADLRTAATKDASLTRRPRWLDELNSHGGGSLQVHADGAASVTNLAPTIVRCHLNGSPEFAWRVDQLVLGDVTEAEDAGRFWAVSGRGVLSLLADAVVFPELPLARVTPDDRLFTFASFKYDEGADARWAAAVEVKKQDDPATPWAAAPAYDPAWVDPDAYWIWSSATPRAQPPGFTYFRTTFTTSSARDFAVFAAADDAFELFIDGELVLAKGEPLAWRTAQRRDLTLDAGEHVVAVRAENYIRSYGDSPAGFICSIVPVAGDADAGETFGTPILRSDSSWSCLGYPDPPPGFWPGELLRILHEEAVARGVTSLQQVTLDFSDTLGSDGQAFAHRVDLSLRVGVDYYQAVQILAESGFDVRMTHDLKLQCFNTQGSQAGVEFERGVNIVSLSHEVAAPRYTALLTRDVYGWQVQATGSPHGRREGFLSLGDATSPEQAARSIGFAFGEHAAARLVSTVEHADLPGVQPYTDYDVGDDVLAPDHMGAVILRRVLSVAVVEDDDGNVTFSPEVESVAT